MGFCGMDKDRWRWVAGALLPHGEQESTPTKSVRSNCPANFLISLSNLTLLSPP
jgi:hypothetical protein